MRHSSGEERTLPLRPQTVASFYAEYRRTLASLAVDVVLDTLPCELKTPIRFEEDSTHASYDAAAVTRFWHALLHVHVLLQRFSTRFYGKISPVHFFWGSFDLAVTRFSGRPAPPKAGADRIQAGGGLGPRRSTGAERRRGARPFPVLAREEKWYRRLPRTLRGAGRRT